MKGFMRLLPINVCLVLTTSLLTAVSTSQAADSAPAPTIGEANEPATTKATTITEVTTATTTTPDAASERTTCEAILKGTVRAQNFARLSTFCQRITRLDSCASTEGQPIHHAESLSGDARGKRILVLGLIHGDEPLAGEMALEWAERLNSLKTTYRNSWRVVPMLNPDGLKRKTRTNARGVDLNRNFPTKDWPEEAVTYWKKQAKEDPRRFPGDTPGSEAETKCAIAQIKDFKPDFIVSVHTPYKVLDFDGPQMTFPAYKDLPWRALGNFPGSLGRFMWRDYQIPVLTIELGQNMVDSAQLQDIIGSFAIEASRRSGKKMAGLTE